MNDYAKQAERELAEAHRLLAEEGAARRRAMLARVAEDGTRLQELGRALEAAANEDNPGAGLDAVGEAHRIVESAVGRLCTLRYGDRP